MITITQWDSLPDHTHLLWAHGTNGKESHYKYVIRASS